MKYLIFWYPISINIAQEDQIDIRSVNISGNESINKKELMPLLRQRPSNFSFTFKFNSHRDRDHYLCHLGCLALHKFYSWRSRVDSRKNKS